MTRLRITMALALAAVPITTWAGESPAAASRVELEKTVVTGSEELPKVLYIVPWHDSESIPRIGLDPSVVELDVFRRLDPQSHRQSLERRSRLEAEASAAP